MASMMKAHFPGSLVAARAVATMAAAALAMISLTGCSGDVRPPVENPAPARLVRVHGAADPTLELKVSIRYFTGAPGCRRTSSFLRRLDGDEGAPQMREVAAEVTRAADGRYEALVPLDQFVPGECDWHPFVIAFQVQNAAGLSTGQFVADANGRTWLEPGAQGFVWVDSAIRRARVSTGPLPAGAHEVQPLELLCRPNSVRGVQGLSCVTPRPGVLTVIAEEAETVQVDFRDLSGMGGEGGGVGN